MSLLLKVSVTAPAVRRFQERSPSPKGVEAKQEDFEASKPKEAAGRGEQEAKTPKQRRK